MQYLLSKFLLAFVDISVELVSVFSDRELLVVINRNVDLLRAHWLVLGIVELRDVGVTQGLLRRQSLVWVELEETLQEVQSVVRGRREHVPQPLRLGLR